MGCGRTEAQERAWEPAGRRHRDKDTGVRQGREPPRRFRLPTLKPCVTDCSLNDLGQVT